MSSGALAFAEMALVAGVVLGALANRLAQRRSVEEEEYEPDWEA